VDTHRRVPWEERSAEILQQYPSITAINWRSEFDRTPEMFARLVKDVLKLEGESTGRSGPRAQVGREVGMAKFRQMVGADYTTLPFVPALESLLQWHLPRARGGKPAGIISIRALERKTGLSRPLLHRLLSGQRQPTVPEMTAVAAAFGKHGSFFLEYRVSFVAGALVDRLEDLPEASIFMYRELTKIRSKT
jgi:transcriptional regulator with XRE-family HTH domain